MKTIVQLLCSTLAIFAFGMISDANAQEMPEPVPISKNNLHELVELPVLEGHTDKVNAIAFSPTQNILASGGDDNLILLWDLNTGETLAELMGHTRSIETVAFSPDGQILASGSKDETIILWDIESLEEIATLTGHTGQVRDVAFSPDGDTLASVSMDGSVRLWDIENEIEESSIERFFSLFSVAYHPLGKEIAVGIENTVEIIDVESQETSTIVEGFSAEVTGVAYSPDGMLIAGVADFGDLIVWDIEADEALFSISGVAVLDAIAFTPDSTLLTIGNGLRLQVLDSLNGDLLFEARVSENSIQSVAISSKGDIIAATSSDIIHIWKTPEAAG